MLNGIPSGVRAAIVDEENFERSIFPLKDFRNVSCQRLKSQRVAIRRHNNGNAAPHSICHSRVAHSAYCAPKGIFRNIAASQRRMMPLLNGRNKR